MNKLNAKDFLAMLASGCANLENYSNEIDTLNVFPVPDGDTGTNMSMTFTNGYNEVCKGEYDSVSDLAKTFSKGLLMGARGNSGVITSQIFRGFYQSIDGKVELEVEDVSKAFENGARVAYKAIMKPVEGTILTVIREASWYANHDFETENFDLKTYFDRLHKYCYESLQRTPDYLPVLKEVGVVDSGGTGILRIIEGFKKFVDGEPVEFKEKKETVQVNPALLLENEEFGYCTEFILRLNEDIQDSFDEKVLKNKLTEMGGESLVVVKDEELVKVHVHTLTPGNALNIGQRYGEFIKLKIENMQEQHSTITGNASKKEEAKPVNKEPKKYGIIAVAAGEGITNLFKELGADIIVSGGQTMNPSTQDFIKEIESLDHCENIVILPNNSNIVLAAKQTISVLPDRNIFVLETKSIQAGVSALSVFDSDADPSDLMEGLQDIISNIDIANITYAIKDTSYEGVQVNKNDFMSMANKSILSSNPDLKTVIKDTLDYFIKQDDKEILTVITGEGSSSDIDSFIEEYINDNSKFEVQIIEGNQPVYSYLFGLE